MAHQGLIPFCNIYSTFMQRAFDQVIHDVAIQNLECDICLDRAGLVGEDGQLIMAHLILHILNASQT